MADEERKKSRVSMMIPKTGLPKSTKPQSMGMLASSKSSGLSGTRNMTMSRMRMRRMSYGFGAGIAGLKTVDTTQVPPECKRPQPFYLPTYQLDPHPDQAFNIAKVTKMAELILRCIWTGHKYHITESPALALRIASEMMRKVKNMSFNRYRVISVVTIGQKRAQSYNNAIAFLWDHVRDRYVNVSRESTTNFIQITVFGIYLD